MLVATERLVFGGFELERTEIGSDNTPYDLVCTQSVIMIGASYFLEEACIPEAMMLS